MDIKRRMDIKIGRFTIGERFPVFIVAETGTNHNGDIDIAIKMIEGAAACGADAVKFQTIDAEASYIKGTLPYKIYSKINFTINEWGRLKKAAKKNNIIFFSAPADLESAEIFKKVKLPVVKISSGSMTNIALVRKMAQLKIPVIISTGMSYLSEVKKVVAEFKKNGVKEMIILHCTSLYPAKPEELNLNAIKILREKFIYPIGYSDHTKDDLAALAAVALGAKVVEKHFTIDRRIGGPEQPFSYAPAQLRRWIENIRHLEKALGEDKKAPSAGEALLRDKTRRCLVANVDIRKGALIEKGMVGTKRPLQRPGLNTAYLDDILGRRARRDIKKDSPLYSDCI